MISFPPSTKASLCHRIILVLVIGGRDFITPKRRQRLYLIYKWYILPIGWIYATYHLLQEPKNPLQQVLQKNVRSGPWAFCFRNDFHRVRSCVSFWQFLWAGCYGKLVEILLNAKCDALKADRDVAVFIFLDTFCCCKTTWRAISNYTPFRPFGRGTTSVSGLTNNSC